MTEVAAKPKRRGFDTGQEQYVGGKEYDPRNQWGSGPFPGVTTKYPDLPFEGFFMTGEEIAKAGPKYDPDYYPSHSSQKGGTAALPQRPGKADFVAETPVTKDPTKIAMERIIQGLEESGNAQKNLLARYAPRNLIKEKSFFA